MFLDKTTRWITSTTQPASPIPFAKQEQALINSERWKTMSSEERQEALAKIRHLRETFKKHQAELWKNYQPLLEKKRKKKGRLSQRHRTIAEKQFEDIWIQWQGLSLDRQTRLTKKWKIKKAFLPNVARIFNNSGITCYLPASNNLCLTFGNSSVLRTPPIGRWYGTTDTALPLN